MKDLMSDRDLLLIVIGRLFERHPGKDVWPRRERLVSADRWEITAACECGHRRDLNDLPRYALYGDAVPLVHCQREWFIVRNGDDESTLLAFVGQCKKCERVYLLHNTSAVIEWIEPEYRRRSELKPLSPGWQ